MQSHVTGATLTAFPTGGFATTRTFTALITSASLATSFAAPASAQQLAPRRDVSYGIAIAIVTGAVEACRAFGLTNSAAVVVDRNGENIMAAKDDKARPHAMEAARRKAYTSGAFCITTVEFAKEIPNRPSRREQTLLPNVTALPGGVPIKLGSDVIGGIGVAGAPGKDEECAMAGLEKVKAVLQ
jgi:uncharacterized protein GlcG (DUF336 family)